MKVYIAGFFDTRHRLFPIRDAINAMGHECTSHWLEEVQHALHTQHAPTLEAAMKKYKGLSQDDLTTYAWRDLGDILCSDYLLVDTLDITPRGGREVEFGIALALQKGLGVVGPERNVFHRVAHHHFDTWEEALVWLQKAVNPTNTNSATT